MPDDAELLEPVAAPGDALRRAELFLRLPSLFSYNQPLKDVLTTIAETIVEHTAAVSAAVNLVRPDDMSHIAYGYHNLPASYIEGMDRARQTSIQGEWLLERAREDRSWVVRRAAEYMLGRPEYEHMADVIAQLPYDTLIGTPFLNRPDSIGFVYMYFAEGVEVDEADVRFSRDLARYARPLMDNAWLFQESERKAAELEALSKADQALHESLNIEHVFQAMTDLAINLLGADRSMFLTFDEFGRFYAAASRGISAEHLDGLQKVYDTIDRSAFKNRTEAIEPTEDLRAANRMRPGISENTDAVSSVDIPVFVRGELFGIFVIGYRTRRTFNEQDRRLFQTLATRARLAIQNALLYRETERRTTELEALRRADEALHRSLKLEDVEQAMVDLAAELVGATSALVVTLDSGRLKVKATRGLGPSLREKIDVAYAKVAPERFLAWKPPYHPALIENTRTHEKLDAGVREEGPASLAEIPVIVHGKVWGFFSIGWMQQRKFSAADSELFDAFASRASLAIQNALAHGETQRKAAEMEALFNADAALHRSLRIEDVREALVDLALQLTNADSSLVATFDANGRMEVVAHRRIPEPLLQPLRDSYRRFDREHFARMERPLGTALVEDVKEAATLNPALKRAVAASIAEVPVFADGELWGVFTMGWVQKRTFDEDDRRLLEAFAARASLAVQNALAHGKTQQRSNELEALYRADEALHRSLLSEDVIAAMVDLAIGLLGAEVSAVVAWGEDEKLRVVASRGMGPELVEMIDESYGRFPRDHFNQFELPYPMALIEDTQTTVNLPPALKKYGPGSFAEIPVVVDEKIWALFNIGWLRKRTFTESDRKQFDAFSSRASLAIQNALLFERAQHSASMEERSRIARELHDSVSQALYGIGLGARTARRRLGDDAAADVLEPVEYIVQLAESGLAETRALIFELVPDSLEKQGLVLALQRQAAATQARYRVQTEAFLCDEPELPIRAKEALYRIAQESLHNMAKHAQATTASLRLEQLDGAVRLVVADNGKGFNPEGEFPGHLGLRSMEERAVRIGATYDIQSALGQGATITVTVPASVAG